MLQTKTGLSKILVAPAQQTDEEKYAAECAFWQDKAPADARLTLTHNLRTDTPSESSESPQDMNEAEASPIEAEPVALDHAA